MVANDVEANGNEFELLLDRVVEEFQRRRDGGEDFSGMTSSQFEQEVFNVLNLVSVDSVYEGNVSLIGGQKFPDIIVNLPVGANCYGVEVKTTKKTTGWKTTGNSVLESSRVDNVERIYLFFGRMAGDAEFIWRRYDECLYKVAVTHSPRYLIDMELGVGHTIFDRMETDYDQVRNADNPIIPILDYYRQNLDAGQDLWWISQDDDEETGTDLVLKSWGSLSQSEKNGFLGKGMVLFPEIFGPSSPTKYVRYGAWLYSRHGVVDASIRDRFTSGGTVTLSIRGSDYPGIPKTIGNLKKRLKLAIENIPAIQLVDYEYYWGHHPGDDRFDQWLDKVVEVADNTVPFNLRSMILEEEERLNLADE